MADMICHKVYEFLMSILSYFETFIMFVILLNYTAECIPCHFPITWRIECTQGAFRAQKFGDLRRGVWQITILSIVNVGVSPA